MIKKLLRALGPKAEPGSHRDRHTRCYCAGLLLFIAGWCWCASAWRIVPLAALAAAAGLALCIRHGGEI